TQAADALDALWGQHALPHLGLNPRTLLLDGGQAPLADFGLVPLLWLPTGQPAAPLNSRYAAPELSRPGEGGPAADQYSLALTYAEMLTGFHPLHGRQGPPRRAAAGAPRGGPAPDLDLLPAPDRAAVSRALDPD